MAALPQHIVPTRTETCVERRCQIKWMFLAGGEYSMHQLAEKFGVTEETIRNDIISLGRFIPLVRRVVVDVRWKLMDKETSK